MNIYFPIHEPEINRPQILQALKSLVEKQMFGLKTDSLVSLSHNRNDQFFFKTPHAMLWGRVYFEPFSENDVELLGFELKRLQQVLKQRIHAHIFFSEWEMRNGGEEYPFADYFRYRFIQAETEKAILVEKVLPSGRDFKPDREDVELQTPPLEKYHFAKSSQLTREELAELIDLNLELKRTNRG